MSVTSPLRGHCYCKAVVFEVVAAKCALAAFCHCDSCRRVHSAPMYQVAYVLQECLRIVEGTEFINKFGLHNPRGFTRNFCSKCSSMLFNVLNSRDGVVRVGLFPSTFDEPKEFVRRFPPVVHVHASESLLDLSKLRDGLPRLAGWSDRVFELMKIGQPFPEGVEDWSDAQVLEMLSEKKRKTETNATK